MSLFVIMQASIPDGFEDDYDHDPALVDLQDAEPLAVRLNVEEAKACIKERAEQMADNIQEGTAQRGREMDKSQCWVAYSGDQPHYVYWYVEVQDVPEAHHG